MKSIAVLAMVVVLVAGFAVNGSRAQPVPAVSVAAQQCQAGRPVPAGAACQPLTRAPAGDIEGDDLFGDFAFDDGDPDWHWQKLLVDLAIAFGGWVAEHFGRAYAPDKPGYVAEALFDPAR